MNERIQQLAEQAELTQGVWAVPDFILERFAQLIVRECMNQCFTEDGERIRQHFGVN